jgi:hypothetical protein
VCGGLWRLAVGVPRGSHFWHFTFKQEGSEADLACADLCEQRALVLTEAFVLLKGVVREGSSYGRRWGPVAIWRFPRRAFLLLTFLVYLQDLLWVLAFCLLSGLLGSAFPKLERRALCQWFSGVMPVQALVLSLVALL